jgi:outer membrane protein OmpA-like peptidoglycan-associated protein
MMKRILCAVVASLAAGMACAASPVHQVPGLTVGSVIHDAVDYESFSIVQKVDADGVTRVVRWTVPDPKAPNGQRESSASIMTRAADAQSARKIITVHIPGDPDTFPGATTGSVSKLMLEELKGKGETAVVIGAARASGNPLADLMTGRKYYRGTLRRVEAQPVPMPVLLDGKRTTLPAVHARGDVSVGSDSGTAEFWILDDADYPLTLKWLVLGATAQTVRIDNPVSRTPNPRGAGGDLQITAGLDQGACRAELHGVYFNTGSAALLPESGAALAQVAASLKPHADWHVLVEGHTDNIGSKDANQALSQHRAEAVRDALSKQFGVPPAQLEARGFGADRPIENNATIEGRAHNRRVELSRKCK